jgi:hypothetical protein
VDIEGRKFIRWGGGKLDAQFFPGRVAAGCAAHARRKFEELTKAGTSAVAEEALQRWARIYHVEGHFAKLSCEQRLEGRQRLSRPLWQELQVWLRLERVRVPDGSRIAQAIDYSLQHWAALTAHPSDGAVPIDNNLVERQIKPWKLGAKNWLFVGSELAGQRAAMVMSLVQSAKLTGTDPWAYLRACWPGSMATPARGSTNCCRTAGGLPETPHGSAGGSQHVSLTPALCAAQSRTGRHPEHRHRQRQCGAAGRSRSLRMRVAASERADVSVQRTRLEPLKRYRDDGDHQDSKWTPCQKLQALPARRVDAMTMLSSSAYWMSVGSLAPRWHRLRCPMASTSASACRWLAGTIMRRHGIGRPWSGAAAASDSKVSNCCGDDPGSTSRRVSTRARAKGKPSGSAVSRGLPMPRCGDWRSSVASRTLEAD